jgi:hypothetical protein
MIAGLTDHLWNFDEFSTLFGVSNTELGHYRNLQWIAHFLASC